MNREKIIIDGGMVYKSQEIISRLCTTESWLNNLATLNPVMIDIPNNIIGVSIGNENQICYHALVKARPTQMIDFSGVARKVLLPNSIFSIKMLVGKNAIQGIYWHLILGNLDAPLKDLKVVTNIFPNVDSRNNAVCSGSARVKYDAKLSTANVLNQAIDSVIGSPFNADLLHESTFNTKFINDMVAKAAGRTVAKEHARLLKIREELLELESQNFSRLNKTQKNETNQLRQKLMEERTSAQTAIDTAKAKVNWKQSMIEIYEVWYEENKDRKPSELSDELIKVASNAKEGRISNSGSIIFTGPDSGEEEIEDPEEEEEE